MKKRNQPPRNGEEVRAFLANRATFNAVPAPQFEGSTATIRLFEPIDSWGEWWGMSAKEFSEALDGLPDHIDTIELLINSPGGEVWDGMAIVNVLRAHPARTRAVVQGLAASAASFIACAADETLMMPNSTLMIHNSWGLCRGNASDMIDMAALLEKLDANINDIYVRKSGGDPDEIAAMMDAETWLSDTEAVAAGLADATTEPDDDADETAPTSRFNPAEHIPATSGRDDSALIAAHAQRRRR
ncbi:MAG: head maturation protease, ClpP-related [Actinomycetota bacterium]